MNPETEARRIALRAQRAKAAAAKKARQERDTVMNTAAMNANLAAENMRAWKKSRDSQPGQ